MLHAIALFTIFGMTSVDAPAPRWSTDYAATFKQTRNDDRPMLVVIDQPGVDNNAIQEAILNDAVDGALADYDLCHVDATTTYGKKVAEAFETTSYPFVAITDKTGSVILHSQEGEISTETWNTMVTKYRTGTKPVTHVVSKPVVRSAPVSSSYQPYTPTAKPYCAKCQRGY